MDRRQLLLLIPLVLLTACDMTPSGDKAVETGKGYTIKTIDGCEYIEVSYGPGLQSGYYSLTHKGNCKNPIHRCVAPAPESQEE